MNGLPQLLVRSTISPPASLIPTGEYVSRRLSPESAVSYFFCVPSAFMIRRLARWKQTGQTLSLNATCPRTAMEGPI